MSELDATHPADLTEEQMTLLGHLNELRIRLTWAVGSVFLTTILSFAFAEPLLRFLLTPYSNSQPDGAAELQTLRPTEGIETFFKVSLMAGAIIAMPMILYQV